MGLVLDQGPRGAQSPCQPRPSCAVGMEEGAASLRTCVPEPQGLLGKPRQTIAHCTDGKWGWMVGRARPESHSCHCVTLLHAPCAPGAKHQAKLQRDQGEQGLTGGSAYFRLPMVANSE